MRVGRGVVEILFCSVSLMAAISCLSRPDYNLPLFAFMWWVFFHVPDDRKERQQKYMLIFVCLSCVQDLIYLIYWPFKWFSNEWLEIVDATENVHIMVTVVGLIQLLLKITLLLILLAQNLVDQTTDTICDWCTKFDEIEDYEVITYVPSVAANY